MHISKQSSATTNIHFWVPNIFESKGGIQVYLKDMLNVIQGSAFKEKIGNVHVTVLDKLDTSKPEHLFQSDNLSFRFFGKAPSSLQTINFTLGILIEAIRQRPSLILCGHLNFAPVAHLLQRFFGIPYWILVYGVDAWNITDPMKQRALRSANRIISISDYTRERLVQEEGLNAIDIPLLPVTFDVNNFQIKQKPEYLYRRHRIEPEQPIILTVARLSKDDQYKGYDNVLMAMSSIRDKIPNVHYILVGKGDDRFRVEELVRNLELEDCVTLTGFVPDEEIVDYYNFCDVFVMPSKGEGFGIVYLEALACGKPTVGGNQDGAIDALCNGELGILVNPDNVDEIAFHLIEILQGHSAHQLIYQPENLRHRVDEIYGFKAFETTLIDLFKSFPSSL
jgi:glycosyltransferase involved in cell wall biosynthesis